MPKSHTGRNMHCRAAFALLLALVSSACSAGRLALSTRHACSPAPSSCGPKVEAIPAEKSRWRSARISASASSAVTVATILARQTSYSGPFASLCAMRPVTAIRNGDVDGNDATARDAEWMPLIDTPMHPEYPCAHCVIDGAAGAVLKSVFGAGPVPEFTLRYAAMPGVTRSYQSIQQLEDEVAMARIWGGVHYRNSTEVGNAVGKTVGEYVLQNTMRPVR